MSRYLRFLTVGLLILGGCATPPDPDPEDPAETVSLQQESQLLTESRSRVARASPESLSRAIEELAGSEAGASEKGIELLYISSRVLELLYPLIPAPEIEIVPPSAASIYIAMFEDIAAGDYYRVDQAQATFLSLVLPPLAVLFSQSQEVEDLSRDALEQARSLNSDSVIPHYLLGVIAERDGDIDAALGSYRAAMAISPSCYPALTGVARMELARNNPDAAIPVLEVLLANLPENPEHLGLLARATYLAGDAQEAASLVARAIGMAQEDFPLMLLRAQILESIDSNDAATRLMQIVETRFPEQLEVLLLKARLLKKKGELRAAAEVLALAIGLYPDDPELRDDYGELLLALGEIEKGRELVTGTLERDPNRPESLAILLKEAIAAEDWAVAADYAARLVAVDESAENLSMAVLAFTEIEDYARAVDYARGLYNASGEDAEALITFAQSLVRAERAEDARILLEERVDALPPGQEKSEALFLLSGLVSDLDQRLDYLHSSLYQNMQNVGALVAISSLYEEAKDYRRAHRWLKLAVGLMPEDEQLRLKLEELAKKGEL